MLQAPGSPRVYHRSAAFPYPPPEAAPAFWSSACSLLTRHPLHGCCAQCHWAIRGPCSCICAVPWLSRGRRSHILCPHRAHVMAVGSGTGESFLEPANMTPGCRNCRCILLCRLTCACGVSTCACKRLHVCVSVCVCVCVRVHVCVPACVFMRVFHVRVLSIGGLERRCLSLS